MSEVSVTATGLDEVTAYLHQVGASQAAVDDALIGHGRVVVTEAVRLAPRRTGATASAITSTFTAGAGGLTVSAGVDRAPAAYAMHAVALGRSNGYLTYRVAGHNRRGSQVNPYRAVRKVPNRPYLFQAWANKLQALQDAVTQALADVIEGRA